MKNQRTYSTEDLASTIEAMAVCEASSRNIAIYRVNVEYRANAIMGGWLTEGKFVVVCCAVLHRDGSRTITVHDIEE